LGGLAKKTSAFAQILDAAGYELILIETVGAGQSEVDIARLAYTTVVIEAPGLGDDIQAIKAGILEIADILVINKADRPGVENTERALRNMLEYGHPTRWADSAAHHAQTGPQPAPESADFWLPPVLKTIAIQDGLPHGRGIVEVAEAIDRHTVHLQHSGELEERRRLRLQDEVQHLLLEALHTRWLSSGGDGRMEQVLQEVYDRRVSPARAAQLLAAGVQTP
jgi:LAO/AO transport system kinase